MNFKFNNMRLMNILTIIWSITCTYTTSDSIAFDIFTLKNIHNEINNIFINSIILRRQKSIAFFTRMTNF